MKQLIIVFFIYSLALPSNAQEKKWDSTYRPANWGLKVEQFKSYPHARTDIMFVGNSITAGTDWMELLGRTDVRNRGISSDISFGVLERIDEVTMGKPAKIFILIGINDISRNIPDTFIVKNYKRIIDKIKAASPATKIYFHTLLPVNNEFTQFKNHYNKDEHILFVNSELKKLAANEKICLVDLYPHFLDANNKLDKKYTADGLHLNALGYKRWAQVLKEGKYLSE